MGFCVFIFDDVLKWFGRYVNYYIEIKVFEMYLGMEEKLIVLLKKYKLVGKYVKFG